MSNLFIVVGIVLLLFATGPILKDEIWYMLKQVKSQEYLLISEAEISVENYVTDSIFARYLSSSPVLIEPVDRNFGLVIEKIGVNVPVVMDVSVTNETEYMEALKGGVAHSITSKYPSENPGNVYIFAHASVNFWRLGKYATVFNLLRKLDLGDKIHVFYDGFVYVYEVVNSEKYKGWNTYPLTRPTVEPTLTLQTCDPPGTTLNRLVVTAKLIDVQEQN
ncbi:MAG: class E sortase [Paludibacteraceae bacterium]|nr:class E sortase [Paludibacteraceae bacterium]